jgi:hypothetical protein
MASGSVWAQTTLVASLAEIPGLADSNEEGVLVDIVKAIDEVWEEGTIEIIVAPFARSIQNVINGDADFHIPGFVANVPDPSLPVPLARCPVPLGEVEIVIYSNVRNPVSREDIEAAMAAGGECPARYWAVSWMQALIWPSPTSRSGGRAVLHSSVANLQRG